MTKDYYQILQVDPFAEQEVIEGAKRGLAKKYHPDKNMSSDTTLRMQEIFEAYEILKDPIKRAQYDKKRSAHISASENGQYRDEERKRRAKETDDARHRVEYERQQREKAEQESVAKKRAAEQERIAREKAERETIHQEQKKKVVRIWLLVIGFTSLLLFNVFLISREKVRLVKEDRANNQLGIAVTATPKSTPLGSSRQAQSTRTVQAEPERVYCEISQPVMLTIPNKYVSINLRKDCWTRGVDDPTRYGNGFFESTSDSNATYIVQCSNGREFSARGYMQAYQYMGCEPPLYFKAKDKALVLKVRKWKLSTFLDPK